MKTQWKDRDIQLSTLVKLVCQFFEETNFTVSVSNPNADYFVLAKPKRRHEICENIQVFIEGDPNDFTVKFVAGAHSRDLIFFGALTSFLGGGSLGLKGLKSKEALEKLERNFWIFLTHEISDLSGS
jgi:hypothetical protein